MRPTSRSRRCATSSRSPCRRRGQGLRHRSVPTGLRPIQRRLEEFKESHHDHLRGHRGDAAVGLPAHHHRGTHPGDRRHRGGLRARSGRGAGAQRHHRPVGVFDQPADPCWRSRPAPTTRSSPHRPVPGGPARRREPRTGLLHGLSRHGPCGAGLRADHRRRGLLPELHPAALLQQPRGARRHRHLGGAAGRPHPGPGHPDAGWLPGSVRPQAGDAPRAGGVSVPRWCAGRARCWRYRWGWR